MIMTVRTVYIKQALNGIEETVMLTSMIVVHSIIHIYHMLLSSSCYAFWAIYRTLFTVIG